MRDMGSSNLLKRLSCSNAVVSLKVLQVAVKLFEKRQDDPAVKVFCLSLVYSHYKTKGDLRNY